MKLFLNHKSYIIILFLLALFLRLYGINWDQGQHLHPDERFLTMVANDIKIPDSLPQYFSTHLSPLNPYNYPQYQFFVYGTFPLFLTKFVAVIFRLDNYENLVIVGRVLSALFDSLNIFLLYLLSKRIFKTKLVYLPSLLYVFCVLPIQLSHFFTVDTFLSTFLLATFVLLVYDLFPLAAVTFGLALACKISALYFIPIIFIFFIFNNKKFVTKLQVTGYSLLITFFVFRIFQPYAFSSLFDFNPNFVQSLKTLQNFSKPDGNYPPSVQWLSIGSPLLFSLKNIALWGLGLPVFLGILLSLKKIKNKIIIFSIIWLLFLFIYQGSQFTPTMRYFLPIYPFILLVFSYLSKSKKLTVLVIILHLLWGLSFLNIYSRHHTRVDSSLWIYQNIPAGVTITNEYWDDPLPLNISPYQAGIYHGIMISPYDPDTSEKITKLNSQIYSADFVFMSSNRLWRSISSVPGLYPFTSRYYQDLFEGNLKYRKILEANSYPGFNIPFLKQCYYFGPTNFPGIKNRWFQVDPDCFYPGIYLRDDTAEEAFTVYDHPKVLIFGEQK